MVWLQNSLKLKLAELNLTVLDLNIVMSSTKKSRVCCPDGLAPTIMLFSVNVSES